MEINELVEYKKKIYSLSNENKINREKYLRNLAIGKLYGPSTGYASIDKVSDKIERQIRKNKTRMHKKVNKDLTRDFVLDFEEQEENDNVIVKRKVIEDKPMNEEEAILQMELLGHEFFAFRNVETKDVNILYKRKDGDYGILEIK